MRGFRNSITNYEVVVASFGVLFGEEIVGHFMPHSTESNKAGALWTSDSKSLNESTMRRLHLVMPADTKLSPSTEDPSTRLPRTPRFRPARRLLKKTGTGDRPSIWTLALPVSILGSGLSYKATLLPRILARTITNFAHDDYAPFDRNTDLQKTNFPNVSRQTV
jgi:hypothetical protein